MMSEMISSSSLMVSIWIALALSLPLGGSLFMVLMTWGSLCSPKTGASSLMSHNIFSTLSSTADQQMIEDMVVCRKGGCYNTRLVTIKCKVGALRQGGMKE